MLSIHEIRTADGLASLAGAWRALEAADPQLSVFQTFTWATIYWRHFAEGRRLHVLEVRDGAETVAIVPWMRCRLARGRLPAGKLAWLGQGPSDRVGPLIPARHAEVLPLVLDYAVAQIPGWTLMDLRDAPAETPVAAAWPGALAAAGLQPFAYPGERLPCVRIRGTWAEFYAGQFATKSRNRDQHLRRKLAAADAVRIRHLQTPGESAGLGARIRGMNHRQTNRLRPYRNPFRQPRLGRFLDDVTQALAQEGHHWTSVLEVAGRMIAYQFGFQYRRMYYAYFTGYDPAFADCGPGRLLLLAHVEEAFARGFDEVNFLRGNEGFKQYLCNDARQNLALLAHRGGVGGRLLKAAMDLRQRRARSLV